MDVELMTLGYLMSGPKTGYRMKSIAGKMMLFYNVSLNQIYPTLRKLEEAGYIKKEIVVQLGKPNKHMYSVTDEGRVFFKNKMLAPAVWMDINFPFLVKALYFRFLEDDDVDQEFEKEIMALEEQLTDLEESGENVSTQADDHGVFIYNTALFILRGLKDNYQRELDRRKSRRTNGS